MKDEQDLFTSNLDYKKIFHRFFTFRRTYILLIVVFLIATFLINRFSTVKYKNFTTLYLTKRINPISMGSADDLFQSFGIFKTTENIDNELEILKSFSLLKRVINETDLKVSYFSITIHRFQIFSTKHLSSEKLNCTTSRPSKLFLIHLFHRPLDLISG